MARLEPQPLETTGINHMVQHTPYFGDPLLEHTHLGQTQGIDYGKPLAEVIDEQNERIEELEKMVQLLLAEVLPERLI